jgi:hypothetical protein
MVRMACGQLRRYDDLVKSIDVAAWVATVDGCAHVQAAVAPLRALGPTPIDVDAVRAAEHVRRSVPLGAVC